MPGAQLSFHNARDIGTSYSDLFVGGYTEPPIDYHDLKETVRHMADTFLSYTRDFDTDKATVIDLLNSGRGASLDDLHKLVRNLNAPVTTLRQTKLLSSKIDEVAEESSRPNWDGEGATALDAETVRVSKDFVSKFPVLEKLPDVSATPLGEIYLEWVFARDRMLTILVGKYEGKRFEIAFAALIGDESVNGQQPWSGQIPTTLKCLFSNIVGKGE